MNQTQEACAALLAQLETKAPIDAIASALNMQGSRPGWRSAIVSLAEEKDFVHALEGDLPVDCAQRVRGAWARWSYSNQPSEAKHKQLRSLVRIVTALKSIMRDVDAFSLVGEGEPQ